MSAKKETKLQEDKEADVGYQSGPLSEASVSGFLSEQIDSGLDLTDRLADVRISDTIDTQLPRIQVETERSQDYPPFQILFEPDDDGDTQLHIASVHGCEKSVGTIIKVCPEKSWLDMRNYYGHTALHLAVLSGNPVVTRMLVIAGASVALRDGNGDTPVHLAVATKNKDCLQALLAPVLDQPPVNLSSVLNQKNYNGQMCVHLAAVAGQIDLLRTLANHGANMNAADGLSGWTPLHIAARKGDARLCSALLQRGCDPYARDFGGRTPRRMASRNSASHAFAAFSNDSDSESEDEDGLSGWTPLHIAARKGDARLCSALLQRGCDPYARDFGGRTPRRMASRNSASHAFAAFSNDSDSESEDEMYDSDAESLFEKFRDNANAINVA